MAEPDWLTGTDPDRMLEALAGKASRRKLWLFVAASCRDAEPFLPQELRRAVAEISLGLAEGRASRGQRYTAWQTFVRWKERFIWEQDFERAATIRDFQFLLARLLRQPILPDDEELHASLATAEERAGRAARWACSLGCVDLESQREALKGTYRRALCATLRDIFGPSPGRSFSVSPWLLAWQDGVIGRLAEAIYDERAFDRLPILADALEDAGCPDLEILDHCRQPGQHVRGCWLLDLLLSLG